MCILFWNPTSDWSDIWWHSHIGYSEPEVKCFCGDYSEIQSTCNTVAHISWRNSSSSLLIIIVIVIIIINNYNHYFVYSCWKSKITAFSLKIIYCIDAVAVILIVKWHNQFREVRLREERGGLTAVDVRGFIK